MLLDNSIIKLENVSKYFFKQCIFEKINLEINKGEMVSLFAPSGVGKTTLIKMIMGLIKPSAGSIFILGKKLPNTNVLKSIGYMNQGDALYGELSAVDNLKYFASMYGIRGRLLKEKIKEVLEFLNLDKFNNKSVANFSGGMKQRLSLGISMLHDPDILILDEPTVGIDPALRKIFWARFHELKKAGKTIIVSSHLMDEIEQTDRVCLIGLNKILALNTVEHLKTESQCSNMDDVYMYFKNKFSEL